jgi:hypothetical protein
MNIRFFLRTSLATGILACGLSMQPIRAEAQDGCYAGCQPYLTFPDTPTLGDTPYLSPFNSCLANCHATGIPFP